MKKLKAKKLMALLLTAAMAFSMAGCGGKDAEDTTETVQQHRKLQKLRQTTKMQIPRMQAIQMPQHLVKSASTLKTVYSDS